MHISLTPQLEKYAKEKVKSGLYNNASEVLREAMRLMIERDKAKNRLKSEVSAGFEQIAKGDSITISSKEEFINLAKSGK